MARPGDPYPKGNRRVRTLTNAATRNDRPGFGLLKRNQGENKRSIRRMIKRDPAKGTSQPFADQITTTKMAGNQPTSASIVSKSDKTPAANKGLKVVRPARKRWQTRLKQGQ